MRRGTRTSPARSVRAWLAVLVGLVLVGAATPAVAADAGSPTGTVVTGRVTDAAGNPLAGVQVFFDDNFDFNNPTVPVLATTTASDGRYRAVRATTAGPTWLSFVGRDATGRSSNTGYLNAYRLDPDGGRTVVTPQAGGRVSGADVTLAVGAGARGRVTTSDGTPLTHVEVDLVAEGLDYELNADLPAAYTDARGNWSLRGVNLGGLAQTPATFRFATYDATGGTSATGYPDACLGLVPTPCERGDQYVGPTPRYVQLVPGRAAPATDIALPPAAELHGRVTDLAGTPIAGNIVSTYGEVTTPDGTPALAGGVVSQLDGTWTDPRLLPQTYSVCYSSGGTNDGSGPDGRTGYGWVPECAHDSPLSAGPRAGTLYPLAAGQSVEVDDSLVANGGITGRVVDEQGVAVVGASVVIGVVDADGRFVTTGRAIRSGRNGVYKTLGVTPGARAVCATAPGFRDTCPPSSGAGTPVTVRSSQTATVPDIVLHRRS